MFFLKCRAARASAGSRAGPRPTGLAGPPASRASPPPPPPPRGGGGEALFPSIDPVGLEAQLLSDHFSGLAALKPVLDRFAFERFVEFTTDLDRRLFDRCLLHVLAHCSPDSPSFNSAQPQCGGRIVKLDQMRIRAPKILVIALIGLLSATLLCSVLLNAWGYWQIYGIGGWRDQVFESEGAVASERALRDFREGHLRLYCLGGENEHAKYTGTNDGPFEMWIPTFYPSLGRAHRYSTEQFIEFYNRKMRYMHLNPDKFGKEGVAAPTDMK